MVSTNGDRKNQRMRKQSDRAGRADPCVDAEDHGCTHPVVAFPHPGGRGISVPNKAARGTAFCRTLSCNRLAVEALRPGEIAKSRWTFALSLPPCFTFQPDGGWNRKGVTVATHDRSNYFVPCAGKAAGILDEGTRKCQHLPRNLAHLLSPSFTLKPDSSPPRAHPLLSIHLLSERLSGAGTSDLFASDHAFSMERSVNDLEAARMVR